MTPIITAGKALVAVLLFRLMFGGYIAGMDQYSFGDTTSALTVLFIYGLLGAFTVVFLLGSRIGLLGLIGFDCAFLVLQIAFMAVSLGQIADAGPHSPANNVEATIVMVSFSVLTLALALKTYKETKKQKAPKPLGVQTG
jgi:hypothetical protein